MPTSLAIATFLVALALMALLYRYIARRLGPPTCSICGKPIESDSHAQHDMGLCDDCMLRSPRQGK